jgi:hypothetical protein
LSATWNPDNAIQDIWVRITYAKVYAINAGAPLSDGAIMSLTLETLAESGVFTTAIEKWDDKEEEEQTWVAFQKHFNKANQTRLEQLTTKQAGYHGANAAKDMKPAAMPPTAKVPIPTKEPYVVMTDSMVKMYYCWTHGLGRNPDHTSANCIRKATNHKDKATATNIMSGNSSIVGSNHPPREGRDYRNDRNNGRNGNGNDNWTTHPNQMTRREAYQHNSNYN